MLGKLCESMDIREVLLPAHMFKPIPDIDEREKWDGMDRALREFYIKQGEEYLNYEWKPLLAVRYMDFVKDGNRTRYQDVYFKRRRALFQLLVAECLEDKGRFIDDIINGVWCICEESSWVIPAHNNIPYGKLKNALPDVEEQPPYIDLFSAETASILAWTYSLLRSRLDVESPLVCRRIMYEIKRRVLGPYMLRDDFNWMGITLPKPHRVNNWNPWINSNCLAAFLVLEADEKRRADAVIKCMKSLDRFIESYHPDGGCDEGPSYWNAAGASLFDGLELLYYASQGRINVYNDPLIRNIGSYIYKVHIDGTYYVNFSDSDPQLPHIPGELIYRYGCRVGDEKMAAFGANFFKGPENNGLVPLGSNMVYRQLCKIVNYGEMSGIDAKAPLIKDAWLDGIQVMVAREREGFANGLFLAAKGGHNDESHNHNDVGNYIIYSDGKPVIIDVGKATYTAKTFSSQRYEIWNNQSAYHNVPMVNGMQQSAGLEYCASQVVYKCDDSVSELFMDLTKAYPKEANIVYWNRCFRLIRSGQPCVEITDEFLLKAISRDIAVTLVTTCEHDISTPGVIVFGVPDGRDVELVYDPNILAASSERISMDDSKETGWKGQLHRIIFKVRESTDRGDFTMRFIQV